MNVLTQEPIGHRDAPQKCDWRRVPGCDPYWVSDAGDVWGQYGLLASHDNAGYRSVQLMHGGKRRRFNVARLVAVAFLPLPACKLEVGYQDGDRWNCAVSNLFWKPRPARKMQQARVKVKINRNFTISP